MASFFDQAPIYNDRNSSIRDLILMQGEQRAAAARQAGEIWGNAAQNIGNIAAGAVQQYGAKKEEQKQQAQMKMRDAATADAIGRYDPANPKQFLDDMVRIRGPKEGTQMAETVLKFSQNGADKNPETHLKTTHAALGMFLEESPELQAATWGRFKAGLNPTLENLRFPAQLGDQIDDNIRAQLKAAHAALGETLGIKKDVLPKVGTHVVGGNLVDDAGKVLFTAPEKPEKAPQLQHVDMGDKIGILDPTTGNVVRTLPKGIAPKAAEAPAELTLNPEGVVLSSYGVKQKDQARKQAMAQGLPVFETAATQAKGSTIAGIVSDAKQLDSLLSDKEVQGAIGPYAGRMTQLQGRFMDLPPKVQRAMQLMTSLSDSELRKRSGASITEKEFQRMLKFTADPARPLGHNQTAVKGLIQSGARDYKALAGVDIGGAEPSAPTGRKEVNSQAELDALPDGTPYTSGGKNYTKGVR